MAAAGERPDHVELRAELLRPQPDHADRVHVDVGLRPVSRQHAQDPTLVRRELADDPRECRVGGVLAVHVGRLTQQLGSLLAKCERRRRGPAAVSGSRPTVSGGGHQLRDALVEVGDAEQLARVAADAVPDLPGELERGLGVDCGAGEPAADPDRLAEAPRCGAEECVGGQVRDAGDVVGDAAITRKFAARRTSNGSGAVSIRVGIHYRRRFHVIRGSP